MRGRNGEFDRYRYRNGGRSYASLHRGLSGRCNTDSEPIYRQQLQLGRQYSRNADGKYAVQFGECGRQY